MKKAGILILIVVFAAISTLAVYHYISIPKEEGIAHLHQSKVDLFSDLIEYASPYAMRERTKPKELLDLPGEITDTEYPFSFFFKLPIGKTEVLAFVHKPESDKAIAWVDLNRDQRLSDEKALTGTPSKHSEDGRTWHYFDFGQVQLKEKNTAVAFHLLADNEADYMSIRPIHYVKGKIRLGGQIYRITIVDGDYDGKFNTFYTPSSDSRYFGCDTFWVDNSYGLHDNGKMVPLGKYYRFARERFVNNIPNGASECYYSIDISTDGKTLQMQPVEPETGTLKIGPSRRLSVRLLSDTATQWVNFRDDVELPAGHYQMHYGRLSYADGNDLTFETYADFQEDVQKGLFEILPDTETVLNIGPPFSIAVETLKLEDHKIGLNPKLMGNNGEEYSLLFFKNGKRCQAPTLSIIDENNQVIESGQMEFG